MLDTCCEHIRLPGPEASRSYPRATTGTRLHPSPEADTTSSRFMLPKSPCPLRPPGLSVLGGPSRQCGTLRARGQGRHHVHMFVCGRGKAPQKRVWARPIMSALPPDCGRALRAAASRVTPASLAQAGSPGPFASIGSPGPLAPGYFNIYLIVDLISFWRIFNFPSDV